MANPDPKAKYGVALIPRKTPNQDIANGTIRARVGLIEYLGLTPATAGDVKFGAPFKRKGHTRTLYPGATPITVLESDGIVATVGRINSLNAGESWTLVLSGKSYVIRVSQVRAEDLEEFLKASTGVKAGDYFVTAGGGTYPIKKGGTPPTSFGATGTDTLPAAPDTLAEQPSLLVS